MLICTSSLRWFSELREGWLQLWILSTAVTHSSGDLQEHDCHGPLHVNGVAVEGYIDANMC